MSLEEPYEGQKFASFQVLKKYLEEYGKRNFVKFWTRSSHTINSLKSKSKKLNPDLKYACMKFACIFGGEKTRCRGSGIRKSSTYRNLGCPCTINAVVGEDGNHVKLETVILDHNHTLGKSLYDSLKKSKNKMKILQTKANYCDSQKGPVFYDNSQLCTEEDTLPASNIAFNHIEILRPNGNNKGVIKTDNAMAAKLAASEEFQVCVKQIQAKYGSNIKIIVVNRDEPEKAKEEIHQQIDEREITYLRKEFEKSERMKYSKLSQVCRLCLSSTNKLNPIFDPSQPLASTILSFKIMSCASIEISRDDELPANICTSCEEMLELAYNFRIRCENSDTVLRKSHPENEYIGVSENLPIYQADLEEVEPPEEVERFVEPEDPVVESCVTTQEVGTGPDSPKNIILDEENEVYAQFEDICPICGYTFETYTSMLQHLEEHNDIGNFLLSCNFCSAVFSTVKTLVDHLNDHMIANAVPDESNANSENHVVLEEVQPEEEAPQVEEPPVPEPRPERTSDSGYLCNVCGKILKSKDRFQSHKNTHEGLRPHICMKCGRGFADRKNMHQHYDIVHLRKAKHECPICHKKFYAPTKMKSHITMHYGLKPFSCDICNKSFRLRMNMVKHKKTHSNERPHKCDKCKAAFIDKNLLTRHSYVHGGIRPHVCPDCGHRFTLKFNLKKHITSGRCNGKKDKDSEYGWETVAQFEASLPDKEDDGKDEQGDIVEEILQEFGAKQ